MKRIRSWLCLLLGCLAGCVAAAPSPVHPDALATLNAALPARAEARMATLAAPPTPPPWPAPTTATLADGLGAAIVATRSSPPAVVAQPMVSMQDAMYQALVLSAGRAPYAENIVSVAAAGMSTTRALGRVRLLTHASRCASAWKPPSLHPLPGEPVVGEPIEIEGHIAGRNSIADLQVVVLAGVTQQPVGLDIDLSLIGMTGCRLAIDTGNLLWLWPGPAGSVVTRDPGTGRVRIRWTPEPAFRGYVVTWQMLVFVPRTIAPSGLSLSGAIEVTVGSR